MPTYDWEDPFGEMQEDVQPAVWLPFQSVPPKNVRAIRQRQKKLLPVIHDLRKSAIDVLRRIKSDARLGGQTLLNETRRDLLVFTLYRDRSHPSVLCGFGPFTISDHPVILPADHKTAVTVLGKLFPAQYASEVSPDKKKALTDARDDLGLIERQGLITLDLAADDSTSTQTTRIIAFPELLRFAGHWIRRIPAGTIFDIQYQYAETHKRNYQVETTIEKRPPARKSKGHVHDGPRSIN